MNIDDSRLIALFQRLTTELLIEKRLGRRRPELTDELYKAWREVEQRGLNRTPAYRNLLSRADRHASWLAGLVMLSKPAAASPLTSKEIEPGADQNIKIHYEPGEAPGLPGVRRAVR